MIVVTETFSRHIVSRNGLQSYSPTGETSSWVGDFITGWAIILHGGRIIIPPVGGFVLSKSSPWGRIYCHESLRPETFSRENVSGRRPFWGAIRSHITGTNKDDFECPIQL